jgi:Phosphotransferase enzyme family
MQHPSRASLCDEYSSKLSQLRQGLPVRFGPTLDNLISKLPDLFKDNWPLVPNHIDLLENNIHVSTETGRMTGICDWKDTVISPFGMSLGGLETMLGVPTIKESLRYHANQQELRDLFWESFYQAMGEVSEEQKELIEVARLVGLFLDNGFEWNDAGIKVPASEGYMSLRYLEAVTLILWARAGRQ